MNAAHAVAFIIYAAVKFFGRDSEPPDNKLKERCLLCGKEKSRVSKLIIGLHGAVCTDCVELCYGILDGEPVSHPKPGSTWVDEVMANLDMVREREGMNPPLHVQSRDTLHNVVQQLIADLDHIKIREMMIVEQWSHLNKDLIAITGRLELLSEKLKEDC